MFSEEQLKLTKENLFNQIDSKFPKEKGEMIKQQINSMNNEQFEEFLKREGLIQSEGKPIQTQCVFCSILKGKIPSYKVDENEKAIAILEIKPISLGHTIVIPKEHVASKEQIPEEATLLAQQIAKKIKEKLNPKDISIYTINILGHESINILPIYENENPNSPRKQALPEELEELQNQLTQKEKSQEEPEPEPEKEINESNTWLPKRVP